MKLQLGQRKAGIVLSYASEGVQIISGLVYTPVMLRLLGQSEYGLYQLVYSIVSYMSLFSLGFGSSYMRFYSRHKADGNDKEIARLNGMFMTIFLVISAICLVCGVFLIYNIKSVLGKGLTKEELDTARILMILMVFNMAISFPASVYNCWVTANEKFIFQKLILILYRLFNPFLSLPLLVMGYGSVGMVSISTILTIVSFLCNMYYCRKKLYMSFLFKGFKLSVLKEMWIFTFFIFINQIIDQINWNLDKFLLGNMIGTTAVAIYSLGAQINTMYIQFSTSISNVFIPRVNAIVAESNDNNQLTELFTKIGRMQFVVLSLILSGYIIFGKPFMLLWGGKEYGESYKIALLLIVPSTVPLIQNLGLEIQRAKNKHKARSIVYLCVVLINISLSVYMIRRWGVSGAAIGTSVSIIFGTILFMNWYYYHKIGLNIPYFWKNIVAFTPSIIISFVVGLIVRHIIQCNNWAELAIGIFLYSTVYCFTMWKIGLRKEEKEMFLCMFIRR